MSDTRFWSWHYLKFKGVEPPAMSECKHLYYVYLIEQLQSQTLTEFTIISDYIDGIDIPALSEALMLNTTIKTIKLYNTPFYIGVNWTCINTKLKNLYINTGSLNDDGVIKLANSMHNLPSLRTLILSDCNIGNEGVIALSESIRGHTKLKELNLFGNLITDAGATALATFLRVNKSLLELEISANQITTIGKSALIAAMNVNTTLTILNGAFEPGEDLTYDLNELLKRNSQIYSNIKKWRLRRNNYRDAIIEKLTSDNVPISDVLIDIIEHQNHLKANFEEALAKAETDCCIAISEIEDHCASESIEPYMSVFDELEQKRDVILEVIDARYAKYSRLLQQDRTALEENVCGYKVQCGHAGAPWIQFRKMLGKILFY